VADRGLVVGDRDPAHDERAAGAEPVGVVTETDANRAWHGWSDSGSPPVFPDPRSRHNPASGRRRPSGPCRALACEKRLAAVRRTATSRHAWS
jgi:hypothetical protein